ncbi:uncharacterized protein LOC127241276 [Andrographis paniculata]|uniref:uncharacterized protein LOC127241276 n=1 Tax=Andrographis paniculata TaxID=175694 RepID=UPI0021E8B1AF|nr:uncharacterized protein LOC127241276 [Andrographis paniculata]
MVGRRVLSLLRTRAAASTPAAAADEVRTMSFGRKIMSGALICLTGGVALSAIDDLLIYHRCSSKAMERAVNDKRIIEAIGEPIVKGPWYSAALAVTHKHQSASCSFPVSGPRGSGMFRLKAVHNGDGSWLSFLRPMDWEILILDALVHVPENDKKQQTFRISVADNATAPLACQACTRCETQQSPSVGKNQLQTS